MHDYLKVCTYGIPKGPQTFAEAQAYLLDCWVEQQRRYMSVVWFRPFTRDEEFNYLEFGEFSK